MKLSRLLDKLRIEKDLKIDERTSEGVQQYILWTTIPFPKNHSEWYVFTLPHGVTAEEFEIEQWQIEAMLRHLWMFQVEIEEDAEAEVDIAAQAADPPQDE
jgi:hypothetical protein